MLIGVAAMFCMENVRENKHFVVWLIIQANKGMYSVCDA